MIAPLVTAIMFSFLVCDGAAADSYYDITETYAKAARNTFYEEIKPRFLEVMNDEEKIMMNEIDFRFPAGGGAFDAFATYEGKKPVVVIAGGFVMFQDAQADSVVIASRFGLNAAQITGYIAAALEDGRKNVARMHAGQVPLSVILPEKYFGLDVGDYRQSDHYGQYMWFLRSEGLAMIIGHEIAHHLKW